jgi:drug/metabolite transporter (DMT)-like permease
MRSSPPLVLLIAVLFLNEVPSIWGVVGIILVTIGIYSLSDGQISTSRNAFMKGLVIKDRSIRYALFGLVSITAYSIADKSMVDQIHPIQFVFLHMLFGFIFLTLYIITKKDHSRIKQEWNVSKRNILITGVFGIYGYSLIMVAFTMSSVSYVIGLRQLSIVFVVFWGALHLKENDQQRRMISASIITAGAMMISILA